MTWNEMEESAPNPKILFSLDQLWSVQLCHLLVLTTVWKCYDNL